MKKIHTGKGILAALCMLILILETKVAVSAVQKGIEICLYRLIPSLFPFLILSRLLVSGMLGASPKPVQWAGRLCRMPPGSESLLLVGLLGGYPVGAGNVADMCRSGAISQSDAYRLTVFCNNAGPAFLFGVLGPLFPKQSTLWLLWAVHILSAIGCGMLLPGGSGASAPIPSGKGLSLSESVTGAVKTMGVICGWVVTFRVILEFLDRWLFWYLPQPVSVFLTGSLELSNGCIGLDRVESGELRFLLAAVMLSFGGLCVWMQTVSLWGVQHLKGYLPGKLLQAGLSAAGAILVILVQGLSNPLCGLLLICSIPVLLLLPGILHRRKKEVAI